LFYKYIRDHYKKANITADLDRHLFHIALVNLIDNAISYTQDGGSVNISAAADPANIAICVEDTGIGIPQEEHERIFERFYRIDKSRDKQTGGAGLGLSIVKHIVKLHNGSVFVESEQGKGSKFFIKIPLKRR
jgi:two-component system phosphate regulon sensor histidine kinase PhoR